MAHKQQVYIRKLDSKDKIEEFVNKNTLISLEVQRLKRRFSQLASQLGNFESLSQGSVMPQPPKAWRWTRKVRGKTVTRGLTAAKAEQMKQAILNQRAMDEMIDEMREITQKLILESPEGTPIPDHKTHPKPALS